MSNPSITMKPVSEANVTAGDQSQTSQMGGEPQSCQIKDHERYQNSQFKRVKEVYVKHVTETIEKFENKFNSQIGSVQQKINEKNLSKLDFVLQDFDGLSVEVKEYFLKKLQEKVLRDAKQRIIKGESQPSEMTPTPLGVTV